MQYFVWKREKGGIMGSIEKHHERQKEAYQSNKDIDINKSHLNYHLIKPTGKYSVEINNRISLAGCKVRKDSVKFIDTLITASPELFKDKNEIEIREYFEHALDFMKKKVGQNNIFSAVVHLDEKTPHMHLCFTPITEDKRLSAKEIVGNRQKMSLWQDMFYEHMQAKFLEIDRGKKKIETKREHIPIQMYKQATILNSQLAKIQFELSGMNMINSSKKKETVLQMLNEWYPHASSYLGELDKMNNTIKQIRKENQQLSADISVIASVADEKYQKQIDELKQVAEDKFEEYLNLSFQYNHLKQTLDGHKEIIFMLPEEIKCQLKTDNSVLENQNIRF